MVPAPSELEEKSLAELHALASARGVPRFRALRREALIEALGGDGESAPEIDELDELEDEPEQEDRHADAATSAGVLEIVPDGFGFLRVEGFGRSGDDVFVTRSQIRALGLRSGDELSGPVRRRRRSERHASLAEVQTVNGCDADELGERPSFADLSPVHPRARLALAAGAEDLPLRMLDLVAPPVKGGRLLISGPPRTGATTLLRRLVDGLTHDGSLVPIVVLVDARPEELADWQRAAYPVHGTAADASADAGVDLATIALERAHRRVEQGDDVLLAIDSISRLARLYGLARSRARGDEPGAGEQFAKRWFAAGRDTEQGGSLTIVATARSGGSLHEALSDVATAEALLDAELAGARLDPPIDVRRSFSRLDGPLAGEGEQLRRLHASLQPLPPATAWNHVADRIRDTASNEQVLAAALGAI